MPNEEIPATVSAVVRRLHVRLYAGAKLEVNVGVSRLGGTRRLLKDPLIRVDTGPRAPE